MCLIMNNELQILISDFLKDVEKANQLLESHLQTDTPFQWQGSFEQIGLLNGKHKYFFHGIGCKVHLSENETIDFDYGLNGRIDGFDEWRLICFYESRRIRYPLLSKENINLLFKEAIKSKSIIQLNIKSYDSLYYFAV